MSYFLRDIAGRQYSTSTTTIGFNAEISEDYASLIQKFHSLPPKTRPLYLPHATGVTDQIDEAEVASALRQGLNVVGPPSSFATAAIARTLLAKYGSLLRETSSTTSEDRCMTDLPENVHVKPDLVGASLACVFDVLLQLSRRDPELCVQALNSLLALMQTLPPDGLGHEPRASLDSMMTVLQNLRTEGSPAVSGRASVCVAALAVASGQPALLMDAVHHLLATNVNTNNIESDFDCIPMPDNLHKLCLKVQQKIFLGKETSSWWGGRPLGDHRLLCSFSVTSSAPNSQLQSPDEDDRLNGAIASDGSHVYVLSHVGLTKFGTGLRETVMGKQYQHNPCIKATRQCTLMMCNNSLYLRRAQSSVITVIDVDSLRDIGEVILPANCMQAALFSDGTAFYTAIVNLQSVLTMTPLNDSFLPVGESRSRQKFRLTDVSFLAWGLTRPLPHLLPLHLPPNLHSQAVDLHLGTEMAFLQARSGKVFYAGNGTKLGLQDTGSSWMELVLPEPVVQLSVGHSQVLFRSGSGHVWIAGGEERKKAGKLRRLVTANRRKALWIASCGAGWAYATENGKLYFSGRHSLRTHPDTGLALGLEGVHIAAVAMGKTHAVGISRNGHVYVFGLNHMQQCGTAAEAPSAQNTPRKTPTSTCGVDQHLFVNDLATFCAQCGLCSARGSACPMGSKRGGACACGAGETACLRCGICRACCEKDVAGESESSPMRAYVSPVRLPLLPGTPDVKVAAVSCGNFHTVLLAADRKVFTFGSNCHGQLGLCDIKARTGPQQVVLPVEAQVVQVAAGANHTVLRTSDGAVYTFGAHRQGQLGREGSEGQWWAEPQRVPGLGPGTDSFAAWIGAHGDSTLVHTHRSLITHDDVIEAQIIASKNDLIVFPRQAGRDYVSLRRKTSAFAHHALGPKGLYTSWCMEPRFDLIWSFNAAEMRVHAHTVYLNNNEEEIGDPLEDLSFLRSPEFAVPVEPVPTSSIQLGLHLITSTFAISTICKSPFWADKNYAQSPLRCGSATPEGYFVLNRFMGTGGGWGYSAHSVEAIQFRCDKDIRLLGVGLYGGRGEYLAKLKLFRLLGEDVDELYVEHMTETDETLFDCGPRETGAVMLSQGVVISANQWHVLSVKISGPSSDCGAAGREIVEGEGVTFTFRNSSISNNGTDVNVGQIPELFYQMETEDHRDVQEETDNLDDSSVIHLFSSGSLDAVCPSLISSLLSILQWSTEYIADQSVTEERIWMTERACAVAMIVIRLLSRYTQLIYVGCNEEPVEYAENVAKIHDVLLRLYETFRNSEMTECMTVVQGEAVRLFLSLSDLWMSSSRLVSAHIARVIATPSDAIIASVLGAIVKKDKIVDVFLSPSSECRYPLLASLLVKHFSLSEEEINTLTTFNNVLRFLFDRSFVADSSGDLEVSRTSQLLLVQISYELAVPELTSSRSPTLLQTSGRFRRRSGAATWGMGEGCWDALGVRCDAGGCVLQGVGVYLPPDVARKSFYCEVLAMRPDSFDQYETVLSTVCEVCSDMESGSLRFPMPVPLLEKITYCIRLATDEPCSTYSGEGGTLSARLTNGSRIYFVSTPFSENGTNIQRGQIPYLIYSISNKEVEDKDRDIQEFSSYLLFLRLLANKISTCLSVSSAIPPPARNLFTRVAGHIMVLLERHPERAFETMSIVEQLLPLVSSINGTMKESTLSESFERDAAVCEAKPLQAIVESEHPYKSSCVQSMVVGFDSSVQWMCVQFSPSCATAQADDRLTLYLGIQRNCYLPIATYFGARDWPRCPLLLPGNSLWFVLETSAHVDGLNPEQMYGVHCTVLGYTSVGGTSTLRLEQEIAWLSASACRLMAQMPLDPSVQGAMTIAEDETKILLEKHGSLLKKGLSLSHVPTLNELVLRGIPSSAQTPDIVFLREFVAAHPATTAGLLARWLPSGPVVDPSKCQLSISHGDAYVGKPLILRVTTKDQFERSVVCTDIEVEVVMKTGSGSTESQARKPSINHIEQNPFQPVIVNRTKYMSISAMPAYVDFSFEEIRLAQTQQANVKDRVQLKHRRNSLFVGEWSPSYAGSYRVECKVDGYDLSHSYTVHVAGKENAENENKAGKVPKAATLSRARTAVIPPTSDMQGVRMRAAPSLQAHMLGYIPRGGTLSYIESISNEDGKWLRLTDETSALYGCGNPAAQQVWCLAYHGHLKRELVPIGSDVARGDNPSRARHLVRESTVASTSAQHSVLIETQEKYIVEEGETLALYSRPSPESILQGEEVVDGRCEVSSDGWISNQYGVWIRMESNQKYLLLETSVGRSGVHSQSMSANGNEEDESELPPRTSIGVHSGNRPSVLECGRAVFSALLWHERLVRDAMAAAAYLHFHHHLHNLWSSSEGLTSSAAPAALQPMVALWTEVWRAVQTSVDQHLITPPTMARALNPNKHPQAGSCELCEDAFKVPVTVHLRMSHPGCGLDAQGHGYNSAGRFTTGWAGACGTGGRASCTWYLLCTNCRAKYLQKTPAGHRQERTRRWREFRLSASAFDLRPEQIMKQNALFLLDLNASKDVDSKSSSASTSGWTINLYPTQNSTPSTMPRSGLPKLDTSYLARSTFLGQSMQKYPAQHSSDPGPKASYMISPDGAHAGTVPRTHADNEQEEVLASPSAALRTLLSGPIASGVLSRPVLAFVSQHHNLKRLRSACEQSIRRAIGFSHAFKVWNWLLRLVSSETSVSDVVLQYLWTLASYHQLSPTQNEVRILPHPWRLCFLAGPIAARMVQQLHGLLHTIAVILQSSGVDSRLRSLCFKAWTIQLTAHEQELLILTCNILGTVGQILAEPSVHDQLLAEDRTESVDVKEMAEVTSSCVLEASSRQAMVPCLVDGSPETFWESGDEDKARSRSINVTVNDEVTPVLLALFIDNIRDEAYRTSTVHVRTPMVDGARKELLTANLEANFCGWLKCCVASLSKIQIVLKGPNNSLRIRQLSVQGFSGRGQEKLRPSASHQLLFSNTQLDAFALFQAIASQAFGGELVGEEQETLRERVVDLLCSRAHLQPLQNYVGAQLVQAMQREVEQLCGQSKRNYSYVCGLMAMLLRICDTRKGGEMLAARNSVLLSTSQLLIFSPQVVQCQVLSALERLLPHFPPDQVDVGRFIANALVVIAKVITLQVRDKASHSVSTATMQSCVTNAPVYWRLEKDIDADIGRQTAQLISALCNGDFGDDWCNASRRELGNSVLAVSQLSASDESQDHPQTGTRIWLASKRFWLSVAALSLVKDKEWLELSDTWQAMQEERDSQPDTICDNHDDGTTVAQVYCTVCENYLCRECFTIMHLHKKNRNHSVRVLAPPWRRLQVDIHQGCARLRLQYLLILFHGSLLNGLVEVSEDLAFAQQASAPTACSQQCRFCSNTIDINAPQHFPGVCSHSECELLAPSACEKTLSCGHFCSGISGETQCLPCLKCNKTENQQDADDVCVICFTDRLGAAPTIQSSCGHLFHLHCVRMVLEKRWLGPRILFRFMNCPLCNMQLNHDGLSDLLEPLVSLRNDVIEKARMRLEYEGLLDAPVLTDPNSEMYQKPSEYAMERYVYVLCSKCDKAYFGGESRCQQPLDYSQYKPEELICGGCSDTTGAQVCGRHGVEYLEYKCRFCCSIAVYFCFGTTHFCAACHDDFQRLMCLPRQQLPQCPAGPRCQQLEGACPLRVVHPPTGEEFALGCGICRNISTF